METFIRRGGKQGERTHKTTKPLLISNNRRAFAVDKKKSGRVNYISSSNKKRQPLLTSLASGYYFDLQLTTYIMKLSDKQICRLTRLLLTPHAEILQPLLQLKQIKVKTTEATYPWLVRPLAQHNTAANFAPHVGLNWSTRGKKNKSNYSELKAVRS